MSLNTIETIGAVLVANGISAFILGVVLYITKSNKIEIKHSWKSANAVDMVKHYGTFL